MISQIAARPVSRCPLRVVNQCVARPLAWAASSMKVPAANARKPMAPQMPMNQRKAMANPAYGPSPRVNQT